MACIYGIKDSFTNELIYIGKAVNWSNRKNGYTCPSPNMNHKIIQYMRSFDDWKERFIIYKLEDNVPDKILRATETNYIKLYKPSKNIHHNTHDAKCVNAWAERWRNASQSEDPQATT